MNSFIKTFKNIFLIIFITIIFLFLIELGLRLYSFSKGVDGILLYGFNLNKEMTHVSTGGGSSMELMSGNKLIAIESMEVKNEY